MSLLKEAKVWKMERLKKWKRLLMLYVVVFRQQVARWLAEAPQYRPDSLLYGCDTFRIGTWRYGVVGYRDGEAWRDVGVRTKTPTRKRHQLATTRSQRMRLLPAKIRDPSTPRWTDVCNILVAGKSRLTARTGWPRGAGVTRSFERRDTASA